MTGRYNGVQLAESAELVMLERWRQQWPYIHVYPPPDAIPVHQISDPLATPAAGTPTEVLLYQVQPGLRFILQAILQVYAGGAFVPGDALWTVNVNSEVSTSKQAMPVQGLINVPVPLGSIVAGNQWPFKRAYEFKGNDVVRSVVNNVNCIGGFFV